MKRLIPRLKVALAIPFLMIRYACSPAFRRLVRMHDARQKRVEAFVVQKVKERAERGDPVYRDMLDHRQWPVVPKDPMARTFTGRTIPPSRPTTDRHGRWKCGECGHINEWHAPTCRCVRNRRR